MSPVHPTDPCPGFVTALIARCADGDVVALGRLFDLFLPTVLAIVGEGTTSTETDARAVAAFRRVWLHAPSFDPQSQHSVSWVLDQARGPSSRPTAELHSAPLQITG